ncbi:MAG: WecB/TagA/CpsF family glycosyltransferase [Abditibacteriota bacterium]|nr:WecB/TagA/CpsF family glycosyltransferase [Abditibacteriota bacterium]
MERVKLLDIYVDDVSLDDVLDRVTVWCREKGPHQIVTADAYMVDMASKDEDFRRLMLSADLVTPDSSGVLLASKIAGTPLKNKASGCVIAESLCRISGRENLRIYFLGASEKANSGAVKNMQAKYPDMLVAGRHDGYFDPGDSQSLAEEIRDSGADVVLVALGIPKQEFWIRDFLPSTGASVGIGIGGTFDVLSGNVKRAPVFLQKLYLEWLYRFFQAPKKSYKLGRLPGFFLKVLEQKRSLKNTER